MKWQAEQSDLGYIPVSLAGDFIRHAECFEENKVWLEIALPTIVGSIGRRSQSDSAEKSESGMRLNGDTNGQSTGDIGVASNEMKNVEIQAVQSVQSLSFCTHWGSRRQRPEQLIGYCLTRPGRAALGYAVYHPVKMGKDEKSREKTSITGDKSILPSVTDFQTKVGYRRQNRSIYGGAIGIDGFVGFRGICRQCC